MANSKKDNKQGKKNKGFLHKEKEETAENPNSVVNRGSENGDSNPDYEGKDSKETPAPEVSDEKLNTTEGSNASPEQEESRMEKLHPSRLSFFGKIAGKIAPYNDLYEEAETLQEKIRVLEEEKVQLTDLLNKTTQKVESEKDRIKELEASLNVSALLEEKLEKDRDALWAALSVRTIEEALSSVKCLKDDSYAYDKLKKDSYQELCRTEFQGLESKYRTLRDALLALTSYIEDASKREKEPQPKPQRSLIEILRRPTEDEYKRIWAYVKLIIDNGYIIPIPSLKEKLEIAEKVPALQSELNECKRQLANPAAIIEKALKETWSQPMEDVIVAKIRQDVNKLVENETKCLPADSSLEEMISAVAGSLARPTDTEDAVKTGERNVLKVICDVINSDIETISDIPKCMESWYDLRVKNEVLDRFIELPAEQRASIQDILEKCNEALRTQKTVSRQLSTYGADSVGAIPNAVLSTQFKKAKDELISSSKDEEVRNLMTAGSFNSLIKNLIVLVKAQKGQIEEEKVKASAADQLKVKAEENLAAMSNKVVKAVSDALELHEEELKSTTPIEAVNEMSELMDGKLDKKQEMIDALNGALNEMDLVRQGLNKRIEEKDEAIAAKDQTIEEFFNAYIDFVRSIFKDIEAALRDSFTGSNRGTALPKAIDEKIMSNDYMGLEEFKQSLNENLKNSNHSDSKSIATTIKDTFIECLAIPAATWIDNLARFFCYSRVPFIAAQFNSKHLDTVKITTAFSLLESLLGQVGITLQYPDLFKEEYDPDNYDAEAIRNIDAYVTDIAANVDDEETIIDLYTIGYAVDGKIKSKPVVSRINN